MPSVFSDMRRDGSHREIARNMPPRAAVDYLLGVIDDLTGGPDLDWDWPGLHLTPSEKAVLRAIASGRGRIVSRSAVYSALTVGRPDCDWPDDRSMDVYVCILRKKLATIGIAIRTIYGQGWRIDAPDCTVWPWEART